MPKSDFITAVERAKEMTDMREDWYEKAITFIADDNAVPTDQADTYAHMYRIICGLVLEAWSEQE